MIGNINALKKIDRGRSFKENKDHFKDRSVSY